MLAGRLSDLTPVPAEWGHYALAAHMGWTSQELDDTPLIRLHLWSRFLAAERRAEADAIRSGSSRSAQERSTEQAAAADAIAAARAASGYTPPGTTT
jgi:hypothetical protein